MANPWFPGAVEDAAAYLADHAETRVRFDKVAALVEGFESPFGLELLFTVHWVMTHESARTRDEVVTRTYAWNARKRQKGWVSALAGQASA